MTVFGDSKDWETILKNLNQTKLIDLLTDILALKNHTNIRITDGPGDGKRDVHSIDNSGCKWLSQSKFHSDITKTVSSTEIAELPLGMVKKGYTNGIFITNSQISPQAKSEFLDGFPNLNLNFLEGLDLVKTIQEDIILKAIWYNKKTIEQLNYILILPVILRELEIDKPMVISKNLNMKSYHIGRSEIEIDISQNLEETRVFKNYRSPEIKTFTENDKTIIYSTEIIIKGYLHFQDFQEIIEKIGFEITKDCQITYPKKNHFALIIGEPFLSPLSGEFSGRRFPLNFSSFTLVNHNGIIKEESIWLLPSKDKEWSFPRDPRPSQADWIRLFNENLNVCLNLTIICPPSESDRGKIEDHYKYFVKWWQKSLFFWIPKQKYCTWKDSKIENPTYWCSLENDKILGVWLHPNLTESHLRSYAIPDINPNKNDENLHFVDGLGEYAQEFKHLKQGIENEGGISVKPEKARHIIGYVYNDPFPITDEIEYRTIDLMISTPAIPTPILPNSRKIQFNILWRIKGIFINVNEDLSRFIYFIEEEFSKIKTSFKMSLYYEDDNLSHDYYIRADLDFIPQLGQECTSVILKNIEPILINTLKQIEDQLKKYFIIERATKDYWMMEIGLLF